MSLCDQYAAYWPSAAQAQAACVCTKESSGNPNALGGAGEQGLWQILPSAHPECSGNLYDPATNARCAVAVSNGGADWSSWTTAPLCSGATSPAAVAATVTGSAATVSSLPMGTLLVAGVLAVAVLYGASALGDLA